MPTVLPELPRSVPLLVVVSGPSGVGKSALCEKLLAGDPDLVRSISVTTRLPRPGETDTVHYTFRDKAGFQRGVDTGEFLEWAVVHGHLYGTPGGAIQAFMDDGRSPVLNVDVQGGRSVKALRPDAVLVFLLPPSWEELERRLRGRGTDSDEVIATRLENARKELAEWVHYDYAVRNDDLDRAVAKVAGILAAERRSVSRIHK